MGDRNGLIPCGIGMHCGSSTQSQTFQQSEVTKHSFCSFHEDSRDRKHQSQNMKHFRCVCTVAIWGCLQGRVRGRLPHLEHCFVQSPFKLWGLLLKQTAAMVGFL